LIREKIIEVQLLATLAIGCVLAAPYVAYLILKAEIDAKL
jgi:hypothetical protein